MWDYIINIHLSEVLSTKIKEFRINELRKKNVLHNKFFFLNEQFTFYT